MTKVKVKRICYRLLYPLWRILGSLIPKSDRLIVINTFPDFDDTTRAFAETLAGSSKKLCVLTCDKKFIVPKWMVDVEHEVAYLYSLKGIILYHRARSIFFTHGCFSFWEPNDKQIVVNLWHGMPMKRIGLLDGKKMLDLPRFHLTIASNVKYRSIMADAFGISINKVLVADHPRIDILRKKTKVFPVYLQDFKYLMIWLPTYRQAHAGDIRLDGTVEGDIFSGNIDLMKIDRILVKHRAICLVKPHPMAKVTGEAFEKYKSFVFINEDKMLKDNLTLYEMLALCDILITDVSSVYYDYKILNKPVLTFCQDIHIYENNRGLVAPLEDLIEDEMITDINILAEKIEAAIAKIIKSSKRDETQLETPVNATRYLLKTLELIKKNE